jgi:hypothetical protein
MKGHLCIAVAILATTFSCSAVSLSFIRVTENSPTDIADDLSLNVISGGPTSAIFTFSKGILYSGFITQIYVEDESSLFSLFEFSVALSSPDVAYASPAPPGPPGVNPFDTSFSAAPNNPQPTNGISAGEHGSFIATYAGPTTFADVETALATGTLRVALHAQGLPGGDKSDSFLAIPGGPDPPLPEPGVAFLGGLAILFIYLRRRRQ